MSAEADLDEPDLFWSVSEELITSSTAVRYAEHLHVGRVPRVSMHDCYLSGPRLSNGAGARGMSTKWLLIRLQGIGKSDKGIRLVLVQR